MSKSCEADQPNEQNNKNKKQQHQQQQFEPKMIYKTEEEKGSRNTNSFVSIIMCFYCSMNDTLLCLA